VSTLRWTEQAANDLASIHEYIARDSPRYAQLVVERLVERAEEIPSFPKAGRIVPELGREDIREVLSGSYRIVYWVDDDVQHVLTVFRSSRVFSLHEDEP
jgi:toxin ParE1/3/4